MEENREFQEALELFIEEEKKTEKMYPLYWVAIIVAIALIATNFYLFSKGNDIAEMSLQLTSQADSEGVKALLSLVDRKLELLRSEIKLQNNFMGIIGGVILGSSIGAIANHKYKVKKNRVIQKVIRTINQNS